MRRIRFVALGIVSFVVSIFGALLAPGTFLNRALSAALCTVFSFNSAVCTASLVQSSERVVAATPPAVERSIADISGYLQAQRDPSEFGDEPSTPTPGSNPQAPPFPQEPGPNFPVRREFDNPDQNPTNTSPRPSQAIAARTLTYIPSPLKQLSADTFELDLTSDQGCKFVTIIKKTPSRIYQESVKFIPDNTQVCGSEPFTTYLRPDGKQIVVNMDQSGEKLTYEILNSDSVQFIYQSTVGQTKTRVFSIPQELKQRFTPELKQRLNSTETARAALNTKWLQIPEPAINTVGDVVFTPEQWCKTGRGICDGVGIASAVVGFYGFSALALAVATGPVFAALSGGLAVLSFVCWLKYGGIPPIGGFGQLQSVASGASQGLALGLSTADTSLTLSGYWGQGNSNQQIPPSYCETTLGVPIDNQVLTAIRRPLGLNECADTCKKQPQQTAQQPNLTQRPCRVPQEFFKDKRVVAGIRMDDYICVIREPVITDGGLVDGVTACGTCDIWGNFGSIPKKSSCNSRAIDSDRSNQVPTCPSNWYGGN